MAATRPRTELTDAVGVRVSALENLALDLDGDDAVTAGRFHAELARLQACPANELARNTGLGSGV